MSEPTASSRYYPGITLFKVVGALTVALSHLRLPDVYLAMSQHITGLNRMAAFVVPAFYLISGFLACRGWSHARRPGRYVARYLTWVVGAYGLFCAWYFVATILPQAVAHYQAHTFSWRELNILVEIFLVRGPYVSLWFIPPLVLGVLAAYLLVGRNHLRGAAALAAVAFLLAQGITGSPRALWEAAFHTSWALPTKHAELLALMSANYLGIGVPFVLLGALIARHEAPFLRVRFRHLAIAAVALAGAEIWLLTAQVGGYYRHYLVLSNFPVSLLLFSGALKLQVSGIQAHHAFLNRFCAIMYFSHLLLMQANVSVLYDAPRGLTTAQALECFALTLVEVWLLTKVLTRFTRRRPQPVLLIQKQLA